MGYCEWFFEPSFRQWKVKRRLTRSGAPFGSGKCVTGKHPAAKMSTAYTQKP